MTELKKIEYAKSFIDKLANGINPLDNTPIPEGDIVNNVRLSRCFFYVSDLLRQMIESTGTKKEKVPRAKKAPFSLTEKQKASLQASDTPLSASGIAHYLNSLIDLKTVRKLTAIKLNLWLEGMGFLKAVTNFSGKLRRIPTIEGESIGIYTEERTGQNGTYVAVLFDRQAQQFIYDNIDSLIEAIHREVDTAETGESDE